jgi:AraC family transcriptional regulator
MDEFEFVWMIEGDAEYRWGSQFVAAPSGSIVLCRPGAVDFFKWDERQRTRHGFFHFNLLQIPGEWPALGTWPLVRQLEDGDVLRPLFRHLLNWMGRGDELQCKLTIATLLAGFLTAEVAAQEVPRDALPEPVERASAYIHERLDGEPAATIDLQELADAACVTPEYLCRLFRASTGLSPLETVRFARLDRAAMLLSRSNYSIKEIAALCGFSSQFHLSRQFSKSFGQAPREVRKAVRAGAPIPRPRMPC